MAGTKDAATPELFHDEVPVLRTSLVRHGLVDLSISPSASRFPIEVRAQEDRYWSNLLRLTAVRHEPKGRRSVRAVGRW